MAISISEERRTRLVADIRGYFQSEFDEKISDFRAEQLLDFFLERLGPAVYNQAVQDARAYMQTRLDDMEGDVYAGEVF